MMRVVVIRHHDMDSAGFIAEAFEARGASLAVHLFPDDGPLPALDGVDHVVVMGAVSSVNDPDPWIAEELAWLRAADQAGVPVLGICFGAQALCAALGGRVEAMGARRSAGSPVDSADEDAIPAGPWLEFHERPLPAARRRHRAGPQRRGRAGLPDRPALRRPVPPRGRRPAAQALAGLDGHRGRPERRPRPRPVPGRHHPRGARPRGPGRPGWSPPRWPSGTARQSATSPDTACPGGLACRYDNGSMSSELAAWLRQAARGSRLDENRAGPPAHQGGPGPGRHVAARHRQHQPQHLPLGARRGGSGRALQAAVLQRVRHPVQPVRHRVAAGHGRHWPGGPRRLRLRWNAPPKGARPRSGERC